MPLEQSAKDRRVLGSPSLGMESEKDDEKAVAGDLQMLCRCLWKLTRYMGDGMEVYDACSTEAPHIDLMDFFGKAKSMMSFIL